MLTLTSWWRLSWFAQQPPVMQQRNVSAPASALRRQGSVALVGAGPGDPELLTRKAWRLLQHADVVVYDALVSAAVMAEIPAQVKRLYVGKRKGQHSMAQSAISQLLVQLAQQGQRVVRLKGGDPLVFGRLGEELATLKQAGISVTLVPGITAAAGCAAQCGFPLTERQQAPRLRFVSAHSCDGSAPDWADLARRDETLVFYMGLSMADTISTELQRHGLPADWPVLVVENGTLPNERRIATTLAQLPAVIARYQVKSPALIYVSQVVREQCSVLNARAATVLQD